MKVTENGFRDEYSFLSNFARFDTVMIYGGIAFITNEHFYQAMKFKDKWTRKKIAEHPSKGLKSFCSQFSVRGDWEEIKLSVMEYGLRYKFSDYNPTLKSALINTKSIELIEYNYWGDKFWGVCSKTGVGENNLGKLLMKIREETKQ